MAVLFLDKKTVLVGCFLLLVTFVVGLAIGFVSRGSGQEELKSVAVDERIDPRILKATQDQFEMEKTSLEKLLKNVNSTRLRLYLKELTKQPHIAAQRRDRELTSWIASEFRSSGLDHVELAEYNFFLSWPNQSQPNKVYLLDSEGKIGFESEHKERELREGDDHPDFIHAFNAYAVAGDVTADLVYVNYGREEDLERLTKEFGVSVRGKICLARYGKIFRGNKLHSCQTRGALGIILFTDPAQVAVEGTNATQVYPHSIFLPGSGIQRGTTFIGDGDPLSPMWPSVDNAYRMEPEQIDGLPKIPGQPIGYDDAKELLTKLGGPLAPQEWQGGLEGVDYRVGGHMREAFKDWQVRLVVNNYRDTVKSANVLGYIRGEVEPDRFVLLGNHRDAWGYGAVDPSSGTAQLLEVANVLGSLHKSGWKPRRTIVFASWAAEEYGLEGSYEWVEDHMHKIAQRAVGVVNTDICVSGPIAKVQASPSLEGVAREALRHADSPHNDPDDEEENRSSYYDYLKRWTNQDTNTDLEPNIKLLGSGTDHAAFAFVVGVPGINLRFKDDTKAHPGVGQYPTYHTGYETFYLMDEIIDKGFKLHRICAQSSIHMLLNMADSKVIPYDIANMADAMLVALDALEKGNVTQKLLELGLSEQLGLVRLGVQELQGAAEVFMDDLHKRLETADALQVRAINDQLLQFERIFVLPDGLPDRKDTRHAIFTPSKFNKYGASGFPALGDLVYSIRINEDDDDFKAEQTAKLKRHLSDLMIIMRRAVNFLKPVHLV